MIEHRLGPEEPIISQIGAVERVDSELETFASFARPEHCWPGDVELHLAFAVVGGCCVIGRRGLEVAEMRWYARRPGLRLLGLGGSRVGELEECGTAPARDHPLGSLEVIFAAESYQAPEVLALEEGVIVELIAVDEEG